MTKVLDSWALLAFFQDESGAGEVENLLLKAEETATPLLMSVVNWGEVWYCIARAKGESTAERYVSEIDKMAVEILPVDRYVTRIAAALKAKHRLSYADCFAAALAKQRRVELITGDKEFRALEGELRIHWIRP